MQTHDDSVVRKEMTLDKRAAQRRSFPFINRAGVVDLIVLTNDKFFFGNRQLPFERSATVEKVDSNRNTANGWRDLTSDFFKFGEMGIRLTQVAPADCGKRPVNPSFVARLAGRILVS